MENDFEALARSLIGNSQSGKTGANLDKYAKLLASPEGRKIVSELTSDGGETLKKAASGLKNGDMKAANSVLSAIMSSKEGTELVSKIIAASKQQ